MPTLRRFYAIDPTPFPELNKDEKLDVRAMQRTFEGAYYRSAMGQLGFALLVLKVFSVKFMPVGTTFTACGILILVVALRRKRITDHMMYEETLGNRIFITSGNAVIWFAAFSLASYIVMLVLLMRLD
ncbi:hypothetical protein B0I72DRAFT_135512 [Yarrowia lipolytica]|jgi:hypothetical protein|uniref:YALI0F00814p n=2 Tax=Yarrowia lipolytica TaxID=4952 RepID=Q6C3C6_YARLI|nr:YALI0F00814p [Yarrowia lipolytica CLIB122]AOW06456.1 hypothetical protein YALI1_F01275g [Yarrowia lipolytica]KAB8280885.1 hypothetical protein BKA91DRAFT_141120 [Yarrowia lipolytica]KAE8170163.1 hypothetical protein BKA90DRAFT_141302 [Yarrowia lipolytica]KAJ8056284.1 hypothetical protein LXG23DRAFT_35911 [Yarrowia lipolytica]QNQ01444.1 Hypothetical protein YALI2_F00989g [Yarrowia lipolytica]|eukprot:XP_504836.1 YALI0F00814p [Yarrowia lipolytica CLIB122]